MDKYKKEKLNEYVDKYVRKRKYIVRDNHEDHLENV